MSTTERAQSDLKKLKTKYNSQLSTLKELFTEWTDDDLLFTLQDADGDLELAIDRISEGSWWQVLVVYVRWIAQTVNYKKAMLVNGARSKPRNRKKKLLLPIRQI